MARGSFFRRRAEAERMMIDTVKGNHYFAVKCPTTGKTVAFAEDRSGGWATYAEAEVSTDCHHCQRTHRLPGSAVFSFQADGSK
jgi:hypothetical protein